MSFYKDHYDVVIIGGALAGLSSALMLADKNKSVLVLEQHNLPGGLATSFVRNEFEFEATLHEMMSIGPKNNRLKVGKFLDDMKVNIEWLEVPEAYRIVLPNSNIDVTLHAGFERMAKEVDQRCPGTKDEVLRLMKLCDTVYNSVNVLSVTHMSKAMMLLKHEEFVKTAGYSTSEVFATFNLPKEAIEILTPYWIYVGNPIDTLPFTVYAVLMADYFRGSYVCRGNSHAMSLAMQRRAEELGVQVEFRQRVDKILVENKKVKGVRTKRGDVINCDYVISGAYPHKAYSSMIEPENEAPRAAAKMLNGRKMSVTSFSVMMVLEGTPEEIGIDSYSIFSGTTMDTNKIWKNYNTLDTYEYITSICLNLANPDCVPKGYTELSITALPKADPWFNVTADNYHETKRRIAKGMIEQYEKIIGAKILDKIVEIEIAAPMTIAHYTGAWNGGIYGFAHHQDDNIVARLQTAEAEKFIDGLEFAGAHAISGNGMGPAITNGRKAAKNVLDSMAAKGGAQ